ncbi:MAG: septum site-determining protein MinC [Clostridia bacterium]|nr:septum site-determining protein MinC [Clostridia bacterium]
MSSSRLSPVNEGEGRIRWQVGGKDVPSTERTLLVQHTLRSGQAISYPGHVVVMGDVNPGAEVKAGGNIMVLGCLRGTAHAGAWGDEKAVVVAFRLRPTQLRIAHLISRSPDAAVEEPGEPEIARIRDGLVVIEPYLSFNERRA